jgi:hypothetical protein
MRKVIHTGLVCAGLMASGYAVAQTEPPPAVTANAGTLVGTSAANTWYASLGTTHTNGLCALVPSSPLCTSGRPAKIKALARSLGAGRYGPDEYAQHVLEYVYFNVETEFRYGLSKGALGALLDQSGTAFDQAHLMVELLREGESLRPGADLPVAYQAGTINLTQAQFNTWTRITNRNAVCRLLAYGGIPADITTSPGATCGNYSATTQLTSVVLSHVWVSFNGKLYDPSYKQYLRITGPNLATVTQCDNSQCANIVRSAAIPSGTNYQGLDSAANANYVQNVQTTALANLVNTYAANLESYIKSNNQLATAIDIVGGNRIDQTVAPVAAVSLPYPAVVQQTWTGDIPDQYRSRLRVQEQGAFDQWLFVDEITGYALTRLGGLAFRELRLDDMFVVGGPDPGPAVVQLSADHPYFASAPGLGSGTYMDQTYTDVQGGPFIVHSWGDAGPTRSTGRIRRASASRLACHRCLSLLSVPTGTSTTSHSGSGCIDRARRGAGESFV